jgi:DNA-directed RNA polymerase subunit beta'
MKDMGYKFAFKGGLSFSLEILEFQIKTKLIADAREQVEVFANYNMGLITNNERYNQVIDGLLQMLN